MNSALPYRLLRLTLLPWLLRETAQRRRVTILLYHAVPPEVLDGNLTALRRHYAFISLAEYVEARRTGTTASLPPKSLVLTLDDGHAGNRDLVPVLRRHGVRATIFVCTAVAGTNRHFWFEDPASKGRGDALKRVSDAERLRLLGESGFAEEREYPDRHALTWEEMEAMREWVDFEPHSRFHPVLPRCDDDKARVEIAGSREDMLGRGFGGRCFAYPNGDYSNRDAALVREAGYEAAVTIDPGYNDGGGDAFRLKRIGIPDDAGDLEAVVRASGLWSFIRVLLKGRYQTGAP